MEPLIKPLGFDWRIGIALTTGLAAKEIVVSTLSTIYAVGDAENTDHLTKHLQADSNFSAATAVSLIIFVLLYVPCFATLAVFRKEAGSWKWVLGYSFYAIAVAWIISFLVFNLLKFF